MSAKVKSLKELIDEDKPRPYDLANPAELTRLYRECLGYLSTCYQQHGTDWIGRKFAMDALKKLTAKP